MISIYNNTLFYFYIWYWQTSDCIAIANPYQLFQVSRSLNITGDAKMIGPEKLFFTFLLVKLAYKHPLSVCMSVRPSQNLVSTTLLKRLDGLSQNFQGMFL